MTTKISASADGLFSSILNGVIEALRLKPNAGKMEYSHGNTGLTFMEVDAAGKVKFPQNVAPAFTGYQAGPTEAGFALTVLTDIISSFDPTNAWDEAGDRFQPTAAGLYQINMRVAAATSQAMAYAGCMIRLNTGGAGSQLQNYVAPYASGLFAQPDVSGIFHMNGTTDYVQFLVDASGPGGTLNWSDAAVSACLVRPD